MLYLSHLAAESTHSNTHARAPIFGGPSRHFLYHVPPETLAVSASGSACGCDAYLPGTTAVNTVGAGAGAADTWLTCHHHPQYSASNPEAVSTEGSFLLWEQPMHGLTDSPLTTFIHAPLSLSPQARSERIHPEGYTDSITGTDSNVDSDSGSVRVDPVRVDSIGALRTSTTLCRSGLGSGLGLRVRVKVRVRVSMKVSLTLAHLPVSMKTKNNI